MLFDIPVNKTLLATVIPAVIVGAPTYANVESAIQQSSSESIKKPTAAEKTNSIAASLVTVKIPKKPDQKVDVDFNHLVRQKTKQDTLKFLQQQGLLTNKSVQKTETILAKGTNKRFALGSCRRGDNNQCTTSISRTECTSTFNGQYYNAATCPSQSNPEINIKEGGSDVSNSGTINFGNIEVGASSTKTFTIEETGGADLTINSIAVTSSDGFTLSSRGCSSPSQTLNKNNTSSCTFVVAFSPVSTGSKSGTATINNTDSDEGTYTINLNGTGVDTTAPTVSSVGVPSNDTYVAGENLEFTVNTSENVTVNTTSGTPSIAITVGSTTKNATYVSG
ncbi:hypothetical protein C1E24_12725, partial [Pseudoalteromonas phenolica]